MSKVSRNHEDTWGRHESVKEQWEKQHGDAARKETAEANKRQEKSEGRDA